MRLKTLQDKSVLNILKQGNIYYADYSRIRYKDYIEQWKQLSRLCGFNHCPIFCTPIDNDEAIDASGLSSADGVYIELNVPDEYCRLMDYYDFSSYLYYSSGQEYDDYFNWGAEEAINNIESYIKLGDYSSTPQVCIEMIKPEWVTSNINESLLVEKTRQQLINQSKSADVTKSYGTTRYNRRKVQHVYNPKNNLNNLDFNSLFKTGTCLLYVPVQGETNNYTVEVVFDNILSDISRELKRNNYVLEYKVVYRAIVDAINRNDIFVGCSCLHPDTKIKLLDGTSPTIKDLKNRFDMGEKLWVYSVDENGDFKPGEVEDVFITKKTSTFIKITLDNGEDILTTPDHRFMLRNGLYASAENLSVGDSLMPLYFNYSTDYEQVKLNSEKRGWRSTYKLVANELYSDKIKQKQAQAKKEKELGIDKMSYDVAIHHKDFNKQNNNPENLEVMTGYEHWMYHANTIDRLWNDPEFRQKTSERSREWMKYLNDHPTEKMIKQRKDFLEKGHEYWRTLEGRQIKSKLMKTTISDYWRNISDEEKEEILKKRSSGSWKKSLSDSHKNFWKNLSTQEYEKRCKLNKDTNSRPEVKEKIRRTKIQRILTKIVSLGLDLTEENYNKVKLKTDVKWSKYYNTFDELLFDFGFSNNYNHKIIAIENISLDDDIDVYDIKVNKWHNFLVDAGVILHNCADFYYTFSYQATRGQYNAGKPQIIPAKIRNPKDTKGAGCKHIMKVLADLDWALDLASCINNYIIYMEENYFDKYRDIIFPVIYNMSYDKALNDGIINNNEDEEIIDEIDNNDTIEDEVDDEIISNDEEEIT